MTKVVQAVTLAVATLLDCVPTCRCGRIRLSGLDSGALAALLKELAKGGLVKRAVEIFDWLRSLDERSDLGCLCDVYTCASSFALQPDIPSAVCYGPFIECGPSGPMVDLGQLESFALS